MYEARLGLSGRPERIYSYSLIFLRLGSLNAVWIWLLLYVFDWGDGCSRMLSTEANAEKEQKF